MCLIVLKMWSLGINLFLQLGYFSQTVLQYFLNIKLNQTLIYLWKGCVDLPCLAMCNMAAAWLDIIFRYKNQNIIIIVLSFIFYVLTEYGKRESEREKRDTEKESLRGLCFSVVGLISFCRECLFNFIFFLFCIFLTVGVICYVLYCVGFS